MKKLATMILVLSAVGCAKGYYSAQPISPGKQTAAVAAINCDNAFKDRVSNIQLEQNPDATVDQACAQEDAWTQKYKSLDKTCQFPAVTVNGKSYDAIPNVPIPDEKCNPAEMTNARQADAEINPPPPPQHKRLLLKITTAAFNTDFL